MINLLEYGFDRNNVVKFCFQFGSMETLTVISKTRAIIININITICYDIYMEQATDRLDQKKGEQA